MKSRAKKYISMIISIVITAAALMSLCSCSSGTSDCRYLIYYTNTEGNDINYKECMIEGAREMDPEELTQILLDKLFETRPDDERLRSAKPDAVKLNSFEITDSLVVFDFNEAYLELTNVEEILLRAALVLTVIQQPEIARVRFTVDGSALKDGEGRMIGTMNADNFVDVLLSEEGMLKQETDLTIYFTDETGTKLIPAKYHFTISNSNSSMEEYIMQQLKAGPAIDSTYRTMDSDVEIISVVTSDTVCYVNFGGNFLEQNQPVSDEILIYSIVNSLCSLPYVSSVQFLVNGSSNAVLHTVIDLGNPFVPNDNLEL